MATSNGYKCPVSLEIIHSGGTWKSKTYLLEEEKRAGASTPKKPYKDPRFCFREDERKTLGKGLRAERWLSMFGL